jgi:fibronectin-binding autotransporter adhesin
VAAAALGLLATPPARADLAWYPNGTAGPPGGSGTWDLVTPDWNNGTANVAWNNTGSQKAVFGGSGGSLTLNAPINASFGLEFDVLGYTLEGNTANTLAVGLGGVTVASAVSAEIDTTLTGTGLDKEGMGILNLGAACIYSGTTSVGSGTLHITSAGSLPASSAVTVAAGATLQIDAPPAGVPALGSLAGSGTVVLNGTPLTVGQDNSSTTFSGQISSSGASGLTKAGTGTLTIAPGNGSFFFYNGPTTVLAGTLAFQSSGQAVFPSLSDVTIAAGATLSLPTTSSETIGSLSGAGLISGGTFTIYENSSTTFSGQINGQSVIMNGSGTLTVSGPGSGLALQNFTIGSGTVRLASSTALDQSTIVSIQSGLLDINNYNTTIGGLNSGFGTSGGTVNLGSANLTLSGFGTGIGPAPSYSGSIIGTGGLTVNGNQYLSGTNAYTGPTVVNGTLHLGYPNLGGSPIGTPLPPTSPVTVAAYGTLDLNNNSASVASLSGAGAVTNIGPLFTVGGDNTSTVFSGSINGSGGLYKIGSGTLTLSGSQNYYTGGTMIAGGTLRGNLPFGNALYIFSGTYDLDGSSAGISSLSGGAGSQIQLSGGSLVVQAGFNGTSSSSFSGTISGAGDLGIDAGTLTLGAPNSFTGRIIIESATLNLGASGALGTNNEVDLIMLGATLSLNGYNQTLSTLNVSTGCTVSLGGGTLSVSAGFVESPFDSGALVKYGSGDLDLYGANNALTSLSVTGGSVTLENGTTLSATPAVAVAAGAVLDIGFDSQVVGALTGNGRIILGGVSLTAGADNSNALFSGSITGPGSFVKQGTGTLTLTSANTYLGPTTVSVGTLRLGAPGATAGAGGAMSVASGATFDLNGVNATVGSLAGGGNVTLGAGTLSIGSAFNPGPGMPVTFSGSISGPGAVNVIGGSQVLAGSSTFAGGLLVQGGSVTLSNPANGFGGGLTVTGGSVAVTAAAPFTGGLTVTGGTVTISVPSLFTGAVTVAGNGPVFGTLSVDGDDRLGAAGNALFVHGGTFAAAATFSTSRAVTLGDAAGNGEGTFSIASGSTLTLNGAISGKAGLIAAGPGTLVVNSTEQYLGQTRIIGGTLLLGPSGSLIKTYETTIAAGAVLDLGGQNRTLQALAGAGSISLGFGTLTIADPGSANATQFSGTISGAGGVIRSGPGSLTFSGNSSFTGGLAATGGATVYLAGASSFKGGLLASAGGRVVAASDAALGDPSNSIALSAGTLQPAASFTTARALNIAAGGASINIPATSSLVASGLLSGPGNLVIGGGGLLRLTGGDTLGGSVALTGGTLALSGAGTLRSVPSVNLSSGSTLLLDNTTASGGNAAGGSRLGSTATITSGGGAVQLLGTNGADTAESIGALTLSGGQTVVSLTGGAGPGSTTTLLLASLSQSRRGTGILFETGDGTPLGAADRVLLGSYPAGPMPAWASVMNGGAPASAAYDPTLGVIPASAYNAASPGLLSSGGANLSGVPEPGAAGAVAAAICGLLLRRRREPSIPRVACRGHWWFVSL